MPMHATNCHYFTESSRPLNSLVFVAPLLCVYELGMLWWGPDTLRNGAEVWLRIALQWLGLGQYFLLPILTVLTLMAWHYVSRHDWIISWNTLVGMLLESFLLGLLLLALFHLVLGAFADSAVTFTAHRSTTLLSVQGAARYVAYLGAGIYEELLFRLMLIPALVCGLLALGETRRVAWWGAVSISSVMFAAAHYAMFVGVGDPFCWASFTCRAVGGAVFAVLLVWRGFGITVGAHTLYDVLAAVNG